MTNEVYQKNIYTEQPFMSAYKELKQMGETYVSGLEVISFHSTPLRKGCWASAGCAADTRISIISIKASGSSYMKYGV